MSRYLLLAAVLLVAVCHGAVQKLSVLDLEEIAAKATTIGSKPPQASSNDGFDSDMWFIRFQFGWEEDVAGDQAFEKAATAISPTLAKFGKFVVDSADAMSMVDMLMIQSFPAVYVYGARMGRPQAPKGALQTARVAGFMQQYPGPMEDVRGLKKFVYQNVPNRYADPITTAMVPVVKRVSSMKQIQEVAGGNSLSTPTVVFFGRLGEENLDALAFLHSQGNVLKGRVNLAVSTDSPLSREYKTTLGDEETGFNAVILRRISASSPDVVAEGEPKTKLKSLDSIAATISEACLGGASPKEASAALEKYQNEVSLRLGKWSTDMKNFLADSPLRKIETSEQFQSDVVELKHGVAVLFILRESDKHFGLHHQIATDVASFARELQHKSLVSDEPIGNAIRPDVFWIDGEVHKELPRALGVNNVPNVVFIMHLQNDMKGVKFFPDGGKDLPDEMKIKKFLQSEKLIEGKGVQPMDLSKVLFNENPTRSNLAHNNAYLGLDLRDYTPEKENQENLIIDVLKEAEELAKDGGKAKKKKLSPKQEAKLKEREEKNKAAIKEEMERKAKEKEERMKAKAEKDAKLAEELKKKAAEKKAKEKEEAKKNPKPKKPKKAKKSPPKPRKEKPPRDLMSELKAWDIESKRMAEQYLTKNQDTGKVQIADTLGKP